MRPLEAPHSASADEVCRALDVDPAVGLSTEETAGRLAREGPNRLPETPSPTRAELLARQLRSPMVALLALAAVVSLAIGEALDAGIIMAIVVANAALGYFQEGRAEEATRRLRALTAPRARVLRDGRLDELDAAAVVGGDIVVLAAGDRVPADARLLEASRLQVNESLLTGEALPASKRAHPPDATTTPLAERATMLFAGTTSTLGAARAVVTATGAHTEFSAIAAAAGAARPGPTPLQRRLNQLAGQLIRAALAVCVVLAGVAWLQGDSLGDSLLIGVSLAVAAVPEGLPAVVTVALALGVRRMADQGAIVRRLQAVETLGSTTVICADKTGTLTENRMALARIHLCEGGRVVERSAEDRSPGAGDLLAAAVLASEADPAVGGDAGAQLADPTEAALFAAAARRGITRAAIVGDGHVALIEPFDPVRRQVRVVVESPAGDRTAYLKGAPEAMLPLLPAERPERESLAAAAQRSGREGARVLLVARGPERGELEPLGLVALSDPPRASSRPSVEEARRAGVRTVMITGDHPETALAIARQTGIVAGAGTGSEGGSEGGSEAGAMLTGPELELLDDDELRRRSRTVSVYARVAPTHKLRIVEALKADGQVAAMTGDGVNDVPAIRAAHVGIAMGHGTDAAAGAADIVLSDDNYATIVRAVRLGRSIYDNLLRFVLFLLSANAGEVLVFTLAIALGMSAPLTVVQILLVNLLTDGLPAIALGVDPPDPLVMRRAPRNPAEGLLAPIGTRLALGGATVGAATFASFLAGGGGGATARTMAFTTLVFSQLMLVYAVRGDGWFFNAGRNWRLHAAVALSAAVQALVLVVGSVSGRLDLVGMSPGELAAALTLATVPFCSLEAYKLARRRSLGVQPAGLRRTTEPRSASDPDADTGAATDHREP